MNLSLGFSSCPNDTFIFDAMVHSKIDTEGLSFTIHMHDVEELNQMAFRNELDITKLSYHAFAYLTNEYQLLDAGSALGYGVGPLLVVKKDSPALQKEKSEWKVAIPGRYTTANFLLSIAYPEIQNKPELLFSEIEKAVLDEIVDAGLLIHENRFTYEQRGLFKVADLGAFWEKYANAAIPLGGIVVKRNFTGDVKQKINRVLRRSVEFAFANPKVSYEYVKTHAQEMEEEVMYKHINLYVNKFSVDLGEEGKRAIKTLFSMAKEKKIIKQIRADIFL
ncbi:MAG: 1,4-dihydroxy-6-naphthoate synthase [Bacteroidia bacterium]